MHAFAGQPMLALTVSDIIFYVFMALFIFGPWLAKVLKKAGEQGGLSSSQPTSKISQGKQRSIQTGQSVALSRGKLEELARQRRLMRQQPKTSSSRPNNLTMGQQIQREQAKHLYEKRAQKMGKKTPPSAQPAMDPKSSSTADLQQQRQARLSAAQSRSRQKQQAAAAYQTASAGQSQSLRTATRYSNPKKHAKQHEVESETTTIHRLVADAPTPVEPVRAGGVDLSGIRMHGPAMLRQAVVFKEILDPPLALRDPIASHTPSTSF